MPLFLYLEFVYFSRFLHQLGSLGWRLWGRNISYFLKIYVHFGAQIFLRPCSGTYVYVQCSACSTVHAFVTYACTEHTRKELMCAVSVLISFFIFQMFILCTLSQ
jgi:hypothetical protein